MSALLEVDNLETAYGASQVLFGVSFAVQPGEVATLLGRNGMGKTTTVRSILGLTPAMRGKVLFCGERIDRLTPDRIARMGLALVPEGRQIFPNLSVRENLLAFADNRNSSADPWTLESVFDLFPRLAERVRHMGNQLSGGRQIRAAPHQTGASSQHSGARPGGMAGRLRTAGGGTGPVAAVYWGVVPFSSSLEPCPCFTANLQARRRSMRSTTRHSS
jgi:ABC-type nitrate/sulfonate/bicarbonate transport system ATPase subunit